MTMTRSCAYLNMAGSARYHDESGVIGIRMLKEGEKNLPLGFFSLAIVSSVA